MEQDAAHKLQQWFNERWQDRLAFDISEQLAELIETSWVRERLPLPYHVYLKMAYYLSQEAHQGEREFELPKVSAALRHAFLTTLRHQGWTYTVGALRFNVSPVARTFAFLGAHGLWRSPDRSL